MRKIKFIALGLMSLVMLSSCNERVELGYEGLLLTVNGFEGDVLGPGKHQCYGRDKLALLEVIEETSSEQLAILCKDELNFGFQLNVRARVKVKDKEELAEVFTRQGSKIEWDGSIGKLRYKHLYETYLRPLMSSVPRDIVSKYETTQIRDAREEIAKAIIIEMREKIKGTPIEIRDVTLSNFDYPEVVTKAQEEKKKREIQVKSEDAQQALELKRMDNRLKLAQKAKVVRATEAEAEAIYIRIVGKAANSNYLKLREIEANMTLYENVKAGDKVIFNNSAVPTYSIK